MHTIKSLLSASGAITASEGFIIPLMQAGTAYVPRDMARYLGSPYVCTVGHTTGNPIVSADLNNWQCIEMVEGRTSHTSVSFPVLSGTNYPFTLSSIFNVRSFVSGNIALNGAASGAVLTNGCYLLEAYCGWTIPNVANNYVTSTWHNVTDNQNIGIANALSDGPVGNTSYTKTTGYIEVPSGVSKEVVLRAASVVGMASLSVHSKVKITRLSGPKS